MDQEKMRNNLQQQDSDREDDAGSLSDLSTDRSRAFQLDRDSEYEDFCFINPLRNDAALVDNCSGNAINFCGKIIGYTNADYNQQQDSGNKDENQKRLKNTGVASSQAQRRSGSYRHRYLSSSGKYGSRKQVALIGLVKIPTEMDLSDIKRRQSKMRNQAGSPVAFAGELAEAGGGGSESEEGRRNGHWSVRTLRRGARFAYVFAKNAFGCFSLSVVRV